MQTRAVVIREVGGPLRIEPVYLHAPGPGEVQVRIEAASLCHSDLSLATGVMTQPLPAVLGHEAAGVIEATGPDVTGLAVGDPVLLLWNPPCRNCWFCEHGEPHLCEHAADRAGQPYASDVDGNPLYPGLSVAAFAEQTVVPASACYRLPADIPLDLAALLGCAVTTGVGAVLATAGVKPGESAVIVGLGGVGLAAVQGARIAGAAPVIAIDPMPEKLALASKLGATETVPAGPDARSRIRELTGGRGADHVFECVGLAATIKDGWKMARRGGALTIVGIGGKAEVVQFSALELFHFARRVLPCVNGSLDADRDLPGYLDHVRSGRLDLRSLVSREVGLSGIADGFEDLAAGRVARVLVRPGG
ncbi:MAG TPA: Zn-dependent alcohol dehydrogenase [Pseudonocardiaceae bacterium]|nr:Zn-dependent alcohol dehydrogenase [Pseudonocardiaceae bacterium]